MERVDEEGQIATAMVLNIDHLKKLIVLDIRTIIVLSSIDCEWSCKDFDL